MLCLPCSGITDEGILRFSTLTNLEFLWVGDEVTREGILKLKEKLPLCEIVGLELSKDDSN